MPLDSTPATEWPVHVSFTPNHQGKETGLYEAWVISEMRPPVQWNDFERLQQALTEPVMLALRSNDCAHVDSQFEIINPYLSSLSQEELFNRFGDIPKGHEVKRLVFRVSDGRSEELKHS